MGKTSIEWTSTTLPDGTVVPGYSFNPWWGCTKVSPGCDNCYAETLSNRWGHSIWGPDAERLFFGDKHWSEPVQWNKAAKQAGVRRRVFCGSMCDWAEGRPDQAEARERLFALIEATPQLDWQLLTKRPGAIRHLIPVSWLLHPPTNVWYGTSVEDQEQADRRIPQLLKTPATVRFLSCEPLLGPINLGQATPCGYYCDISVGHVDHGFYTPGIRPGIDWVIAGGESGPGARPMDEAWARGLKGQCEASGVSFFMKQLGGVRDKRHNIENFPVDLQVREFPNVAV